MFEQKLKEQDAHFRVKQEEDRRHVELRSLANQKDLEQQRLELEGRLQELKIAPGSVKKEESTREGESAIKLPKLTLPKFSRNLLRWKEFWDAFESAVDKKEKINGINKFNYLKSNLEGQARMVVAELELSNENYQVAVDLLRKLMETGQRLWKGIKTSCRN